MTGLTPERATELAKQIAGCSDECHVVVKFLGFTFGADHDFKEFEITHNGIKVNVKVGTATSAEETVKAIGAAVKEVRDHPQELEELS